MTEPKGIDPTQINDFHELLDVLGATYFRAGVHRDRSDEGVLALADIASDAAMYRDEVTRRLVNVVDYLTPALSPAQLRDFGALMCGMTLEQVKHNGHERHALCVNCKAEVHHYPRGWDHSTPSPVGKLCGRPTPRKHTEACSCEWVRRTAVRGAYA